jgi:hypothetical protein
MRTPLVLSTFSVAILVVGCSGTPSSQVTEQSSGGLTSTGGTSATRVSVTTSSIQTGGAPNSGGSNSGVQLGIGGTFTAGGTASDATSSAAGGTTNLATSSAIGGTPNVATSSAAGGTTNVITGGTAGGTSGVSTGSPAGGVTGSGSFSNSGGSTSSGGATAMGGTSLGTTSTSSPDVDASCDSDANPVHLTQVNFLFLLDKSGSMGFQNGGSAGSWDNCATRWNPVVDALNSFFAEANSSRTYASLTTFPANGINTTMCDPASYSTGSAAVRVPLALLDDTGRQNFQTRLCDCANGVSPPSSCINPAGGTPTRPALQGTINYAADIDQTYPNSKTVIVLITDGQPSFGCQTSAGSYQACNSCDDLANGCLADASQCLSQYTEIS